MSIREEINRRPWLGWAVAGVLVVLGVVAFIFRTSGGTGDAYDGSRMTQMVTIKYTDTGDTEEVHRGRLIKRMLDENKGKIDPNKGLINPKTQQPTGFFYDKAEWEALVKQLNDDLEAGAKSNPPKPGK